MRKTRLYYLAAFLIILTAEICIGVFVRDRFIRPYVGDVLVAVLLCCLIKFLFPHSKGVAGWAFGFCVAAEVLQLVHLPKLMGLEDTVLGVILGATFDWADLLCYLIGCSLFAAFARWMR